MFNNIIQKDNFIFDVLLISHIEKTIKRKLTEEEYIQIYDREWLILNKPDGSLVSYFVPLYKIPDDVISDSLHLVDPTDIRTITKSSQWLNWKEYNTPDIYE